MSNIRNLAVDQGSTFTYTFTLQTLSLAPYNLTGYDARLQVRKTYGDSSVLINCTLANSKLAISTAAGTVTITLLPTDTSSVRFTNKDDETLDCVYDLEIISPLGNVYKPSKGSFVIQREVTR